MNWGKGTAFKGSYRVLEQGKGLLRCQDRNHGSLLGQREVLSITDLWGVLSIWQLASAVQGLTKFHPPKWVHPDWPWRCFPVRRTPQHPQGPSMACSWGDGAWWLQSLAFGVCEPVRNYGKSLGRQEVILWFCGLGKHNAGVFRNRWSWQCCSAWIFFWNVLFFLPSLL